MYQYRDQIMSDINLLRKEGSSCTELLECFYDLSPRECQVFYTIASREKVTLDELSEIIDRDRSTTHRLLQKLVGLGLCYKEKTTFQRGGYSYEYRTPSVSRIKDHLEKRINEHIDDLNKLVSRIESDILSRIDSQKNVSD